jgi:acetyl-CoA carboxylase, carboxyl transferase, beta subunit
MNTILKTRKQRVSKYQQPVDFNKIDVPDELYHKCPECDKMHHVQDLLENLTVCPDCGFHVPLTASHRIKQVTDVNSFVELAYNGKVTNPLNFPGYTEKVEQLQEKLSIDEAVITGTAKIKEQDCVLAIMDNSFFMGSMGSAVGEKITQAIEYATEQQLPIIIFSTSGGARMQEGLFSLMQMAKTSAALAKHHEAGLLYISVITNPTTGGVSASYAMLGDIILSEPGALVCFAGPRVIKDTIKQELPDGFQTAEFLQEHGFIDRVVHRQDIRKTLGKLLWFHRKQVALDGE